MHDVVACAKSVPNIIGHNPKPTAAEITKRHRLTCSFKSTYSSNVCLPLSQRESSQSVQIGELAPWTPFGRCTQRFRENAKHECARRFFLSQWYQRVSAIRVLLGILSLDVSVFGQLASLYTKLADLRAKLSISRILPNRLVYVYRVRT